MVGERGQRVKSACSTPEDGRGLASGQSVPALVMPAAARWSSTTWRHATSSTVLLSSTSWQSTETDADLAHLGDVLPFVRLQGVVSWRS